MTDKFDPDTWPRDPGSGRFLCAPEHPMPKGADGRWVHRNVGEIGEQEDGYPGGDTVEKRCRDCGLRWVEELPQ